MYNPKSFKLSDRDQLHAFIERWSFADLISCVDGIISVSAVPVLFNKTENCIVGHLAKANKQCESLLRTSDLLLQFNGPNAYISPSWYEDAEQVPTWNYQKVWIRGRVSLLDDVALLDLLDKLSQKHEESFPTPWSIDKLSQDKMKMFVSVIQGFKIEIESIEGKFKLSQNKSLQDQKRVIDALSLQTDNSSKVVAKEMTSQIDK